MLLGGVRAGKRFASCSSMSLFESSPCFSFTSSKVDVEQSAKIMLLFFLVLLNNKIRSCWCRRNSIRFFGEPHYMYSCIMVSFLFVDDAWVGVRLSRTRTTREKAAVWWAGARRNPRQSAGGPSWPACSASTQSRNTSCSGESQTGVVKRYCQSQRRRRRRRRKPSFFCSIYDGCRMCAICKDITEANKRNAIRSATFSNRYLARYV